LERCLLCKSEACLEEALGLLQQLLQPFPGKLTYEHQSQHGQR